MLSHRVYYNTLFTQCYNRLYERPLLLLHDGYKETSQKLFQQDRSFTKQTFKVKHGLASRFSESIFVVNNN